MKGGKKKIMGISKMLLLSLTIMFRWFPESGTAKAILDANVFYVQYEIPTKI